MRVDGWIDDGINSVFTQVLTNVIKFFRKLVLEAEELLRMLEQLKMLVTYEDELLYNLFSSSALFTSICLSLSSAKMISG